MYQLYKSVANGLSKEAQETTIIKVNGNDYYFTYINYVLEVDLSTNTQIFIPNYMPFSYDKFLGDVEVYSFPTGGSIDFEEINGFSFNLSETNGMISVKEIFPFRLGFLNASSGIFKLCLKGFALKDTVQQS